MDFARKQLEKYGWQNGKGLGKHENGISEALKPKLKRSVAGIGHDAAADFTEHWWTTLYNKAANNVEVEQKNGKTKKITTKDQADFEITNSTWKLNRKKNDSNPEKQYGDFFIKKALLNGSKTDNVNSSDSESDETVNDKKDLLQMTDEELFAACGGRTAHKGARHGLKALGKLARIEMQEKLLLEQQQSKFKGYSSHKSKKTNGIPTSNEKVVEDTSLTNETDVKIKKKKKKKRCSSNNADATDLNNTIVHENNDEKSADNVAIIEKNDDTVTTSDVTRRSKVKKTKRKEQDSLMDIPLVSKSIDNEKSESDSNNLNTPIVHENQRLKLDKEQSADNVAIIEKNDSTVTTSNISGRSKVKKSKKRKHDAESLMDINKSNDNEKSDSYSNNVNNSTVHENHRLKDDTKIEKNDETSNFYGSIKVKKSKKRKYDADSLLDIPLVSKSNTDDSDSDAQEIELEEIIDFIEGSKSNSKKKK